MIIKDNSVESNYALIESLDSPYELSDITRDVDRRLIEKMKSNGFDNMTFYECVDAPDHGFFVGRRDGAYEVHHQHVRDGVEIHTKNVMDRTPSRFVATAFYLIDRLVSIGIPVRIISSDLHWKVYHRLATRIAKGRGYTVGEIQKDSRTGYSQFLITRNKERSMFLGIPIRK